MKSLSLRESSINIAARATTCITLAFLGLVLLPFELLAGDQSSPVQPVQQPTLVTAPFSKAASNVHLQGIAKPKQESILRFPTIGQVSRIHVAEGAVVQSGDALLTLDDSVQAAQVQAARVAAESKAGILQAEVAVQRARRILERVKEARLLEASSNFEVEAKQSDYDQALAALEQQKELHETRQAELQRAIASQAQMTLTAPFNGQVVLVAVKPGNTVDTNKSVVHIADLVMLEVEMHLPTSLYGRVQVGETRILLAGVPVEQPLSAVVRYVSPVIEPTGGTFLVRFEIDNSDGKLPAGFEVWLPESTEVN